MCLIFSLQARKKIFYKNISKHSRDTVLTMEKSNITKLITMIMVLELIVIAAATTHNNNGNGEIEGFSPTCIIECTAECKGKGWSTPLCMAKCLYNCKDSPTVAKGVPVCTSTCAQLNCSKFVNSGN